MRRFALSVFAGAILAFSSLGPVAAAPGAQPVRLTVGANVNTSRMHGNQSETTAAVNPTNPANVVVVSNTEPYNALFEAYTFDSGATWTSRLIANGDSLGVACCDPSLSFDHFGNLFLTYIDNKDKNIQLGLSTNGGVSWRFLLSVDQTNTEGNGLAPKWGASVDQPTVTTGADSVWVVYKIFNQNQLLRARGARVSGLGQVGPWNAPEGAPGSRPGSFGDIAIGPKGQVMICWQDDTFSQGPNHIWVNVDPDGLGPAGFGPALFATGENVGGFDFITPQAQRSVDSESGLAYDRSGGPHTGRVYMVYTDELPDESNNTEIFTRFSDDNGATWSDRVRVNDDTGTNAQFNPRMSLDPTTGNIATSWYDSRNDLGNFGPGDTDGIPNDDAQFFAAVSSNAGLSWSKNVQVSAGTSNSADAHNVIDFGDYSGMSFYGGSFYPAWADNSNSTGDNPDGTLHQLDVYVAKVTVNQP